MGFLLKCFDGLLLILLFLLHTTLCVAIYGEPRKKCIERERKALLSFKQDMVDDFGVLSTWREGDDEDCCNWNGVYCSNHTGHVQILNLRGSSEIFLTGTINITLLSELHDLKHLDLSHNYFYQSDIPGSINLFTNLKYLNLSNSNFVGSIPHQLGKLSNLLYIDLSYNFLEGGIPWQIGNLSNLLYLNLGDNHLVGVIPYQLGNLSMLHTLLLPHADNLKLTERNNSDVEWISNLSSLTNLDLSLMSDVGYSQMWLHMISGKLFPKLRELRLRGCGITYTHNLPLSPPSNYSTSLITLDLSYNDLNNNPLLFQWLFNFSSTTLQELHLEDTNLSSDNLHHLFSHPRFPYLTILDLSVNNLSSAMTLNFGSNNLQELYLTSCGLSSNSLILTSLSHNLTSLVHLDLSLNHLTSSDIFHCISNFTFNLRELQLGENSLSGSIPHGFGNMMNSLEVLHLDSNNLQGEVPTSLGNRCSLKSLGLASNNLSGDLPSFISNASRCNMHPLQNLGLQRNRFTGFLPHLSFLPFLRYLDLSYNQLEGKISESIGLMSQLKYLYLEGNNFGGVITETHFKNLSNLLIVSLSGNPLTLEIRTNWIPPFQLEYMDMASCMIGPHFPTWLRNQHHLSYLDISNGRLSGSIPEWFWSLLDNNRHMNISFNNFVGQIPNLPFNLTQRPNIYLTSNNLEGAVPSFFGQAAELHLSKNKFSNLSPLVCGQTEHGAIALLDLSNNQLEGHLPNCWSHLNLLEFVDLSNNNLSGEIPSSIGHLVNMQVLVLKNNSLTGELPSSLVNCSDLLLLDVSENKLLGLIPSWIGVSLGQLQILSLRMNHLYGSLPMHLCHLTQIRLLDLSHNDLSNEIPSCVQNFSIMAQNNINARPSDRYHKINSSANVFYDIDGEVEYYITLMWKGGDHVFMSPEFFLKSIDLSSNALSGDIPEELVSLLGLVSLNLSRNQLSGVIPMKIGNLESLEFLDLSKNRLSGPIPPSLAHIDRLSVLDLSNNNLSGKIPTGTQLQSFNASSYEGNFDLCGFPLDKMCPGMSPLQEADQDEEEASFLSQGFYLSMGLGFFVGFWAFVGPLLFNRTWRQAYYRCLNTVTDKIHLIFDVYVLKYLTIKD